MTKRRESGHERSADSKEHLPGNVKLYQETVSVEADLAVPDPASSPFSKDHFEADITLELKKLGQNFIEFDLLGVAPSIANALRRTTIAEVPTMAIESVFVVNNTSIIPDEVLSHRLGLVPIHADPRKFDFVLDDNTTDLNTLVFELHEKCQPVKGVTNVEAAPEEKYINSSVRSSSIKWVPQGSQKEVFQEQPVRVSYDDILVVKLRPSQEVDLEMHCVKGLGKDHAKWSPVSCSYYRLMPRITLHAPITGADAFKFAKCFSNGVVEIERVDEVDTAVIRNERKDLVSRECLRHPEFADKVTLSRVHDHFIFHIETVGFYGPVDVVRESLKILSEKCSRLRSALKLTQ